MSYAEHFFVHNDSNNEQQSSHLVFQTTKKKGKRKIFSILEEIPLQKAE